MGFITRKLRAVILAVVLAVSAASAVDMSWGIDGYYTGAFGSGLYGLESMWYSSGNRLEKVEAASPYGAFGVGAFFDAQYAEIGLGVVYGSGEQEITEFLSASGIAVPVRLEKGDFFFMGLNISVLGKYPIALKDQITLFPTAGIDYAIVLFASQSPKDMGFDASALWFKFGIGLDFRLTDKMFIRPEILYGFRLKNSLEKDVVKNAAYDSIIMEVPSGHGPTIRIGLGFKL